MRNRRQFVQDMVAFCEMQERVWDAIHFSRVHDRKSSPPPVAAPVADPVRPAGAGLLGPVLRRRFAAVAQMVVVLLVTKAPSSLWMAAGIFGLLTLLGVPEAMRAAAQGGRGGEGESLEAVLGRLRMREKGRRRMEKYRRRLEEGEELEEKEVEEMAKEEEFLRKNRNKIPYMYKFIYQSLVMFVLTAFPGARFHEELLK